MSADVDAVVIGAGVVGLAVARALATGGRETLLLEREGAFGTATSSRNSEVVHAGIYYPAGSLKARLCVAGRERLYDHCATRGVAHRRCGKLIVATDPGQRGALGGIAARARANGVADLLELDADGARALEPGIRCEAALSSPSTGIVDSHGLMVSLLAEAEAAGAVLAVRAPVERVEARPDGLWGVEVGGADPVRLVAREVVNAAGHGACALAGPGPDAPRPAWARGNYFRLEGRAPASRLVYPVPEPGGLGVHLTLDLAGRARFGPDVEWIEAEDYRVDPGRADAFYREIRRYWPGLPDGALAPDYAGVRPKLRAGDGYAEDFLIVDGATRGRPGRVDLYGIESPGLTACLAIGAYARALLDARGRAAVAVPP